MLPIPSIFSAALLILPLLVPAASILPIQSGTNLIAKVLPGSNVALGLSNDTLGYSNDTLANKKSHPKPKPTNVCGLLTNEALRSRTSFLWTWLADLTLATVPGMAEAVRRLAFDPSKVNIHVEVRQPPLAAALLSIYRKYF
jgi:hypothetical protein